MPTPDYCSFQIIRGFYFPTHLQPRGISIALETFGIGDGIQVPDLRPYFANSRHVCAQVVKVSGVSYMVYNDVAGGPDIAFLKNYGCPIPGKLVIARLNVRGDKLVNFREEGVGEMLTVVTKYYDRFMI